ncbi:MAG: YARHG domain-containing protein [Lachnospiraceae bacterium]|nr:YARHG domain-containing protein [Lachnospiraceae bacterium]
MNDKKYRRNWGLPAKEGASLFLLLIVNFLTVNDYDVEIGVKETMRRMVRRMGRKRIRLVFAVVCGLFVMINPLTVRGSDEAQPEENDYCSINDFEDFHYYLFCNTDIGTTAVGVNPTISAFIGGDAETMEEGVELYQEFMEPIWKIDHGEYMDLRYISPDGSLAVTLEGDERDCLLWRWRLFEGEKEKDWQEEDIRYYGYNPFQIVINGDFYTVADSEILYQTMDRLEDETGYYHCVEFNEQGNLAAGGKCNILSDTSEMEICDLESEEVLVTFYQGDEFEYVYQIQGDRENGKVVYQLGSRDFYEYAYPSGETRYLGKDMYYPWYSPDGKYIAYSSPDGEACYDLDEEEAEEVTKILPGIYILEVETGKTAYIKQDIDAIYWADRLNTRSFQWVEKDCFEKMMEERGQYDSIGSTALTEDYAEQIIKEADNAIQAAMKKSDIYQKEQPAEEEIREYLSHYFDQDILDYVLFVYQIKIEDGKCSYRYYDHDSNFYMDTEKDMEIIRQGEGYCDIHVTFVHSWERKRDEERVTVRIEKNETGRWVISKMNQWYNDFRYYYMPEPDYVPEYLTEDMAEWMIREFGTDENGEMTGIYVETDEEGFILAGSSVRKLEKQEIDSLSRYEMFLAVQEIYARNGKKFDDVMLYGYFQEKPWYEPYKQVFDENNLTEVERYNIERLTEAGDLGEMAQAAYGNRYEEEEKMSGQSLRAEEAACIIGGAFAGLDNIFTAKSVNKVEENSDGVEIYFSLGEYAEERRLKEYVSAWFSEEVFDQLMDMCFVMYGVVKDDDGHYVLMRGLTRPMEQYVLDDFGSVVIKSYNDTECTVTVPFQNLENTCTSSEGEIRLRREKDGWVISKISEPYYDKDYSK